MNLKLNSAGSALSEILNAQVSPGTLTVGVGDNELVVYVHRKLSFKVKSFLNAIAEMDGFPVRSQWVGQIRPAGDA
jgi:hypothetical protein